MSHVVIVGLGFGGLYTLRSLSDGEPGGRSDGTRVTAVDRRDRFVFTPLLYEYLVGELEPDVVAPPFDTLVDNGTERVRAEVTAVDPRARSVRLADGSELPYDVLVLSPGSVPAYHGVPGAEEHAFPFYSYEDAVRLRQALRLREWAEGARPACVVGGGVVGVELAFALVELLERLGAGGREGPPVVVLEAMGEILRGLSPGLREAARRKLADRGVEVRTSVRVLEVDDGGVVFENGGSRERFEGAVVAWAAGIRPSPLLDGLPAERAGSHGVRVERTLQLPGFPETFVLGDAISYPGPVPDPIPDTAQAAVQEAGVCAANVRGLLEEEGPREEYRYGHFGDFLRVSSGEALADVKGVVLDGAAASAARGAAYLFRLPGWAIRTAAIRQWLG